MRALLRVWLIAVILTGWALPALAADPDKLYPDDTNFVLALNIKQIVQSPAFAKYQKQVEELLKHEAVQAILKDTGFDPIKDVDQVIVVLGPKTFGPDGEREVGGAEQRQTEGPLFLVQGRFDMDKVDARARKYADDLPEQVKIHGIGKANVVEVKLPGQLFFGVVVDKNTIAVSPRRDEIEDLLEKAGGEAKADGKNAELKKLLKQRNVKDIVQLCATKEAIFGGESSFKMENGKQILTTKHKSLADFGITTLTGGITLGDKLEGKAVLIVKDGDSARTVAGLIEQGLGEAKQARAQAVGMFKDLALVFDMLDTVKVNVDDKKLNLSGHAGPDAIQAVIKSFFVLRGGAVPPEVDK